eukprot:4259101-Pyramimonas_sp.AAC.1
MARALWSKPHRSGESAGAGSTTSVAFVITRLCRRLQAISPLSRLAALPLLPWRARDAGAAPP